MLRESFIFYSSYYEAISESGLPDDEQGLIYKTIIDYAMAKKEPKNLTPAGKMCFKLIRPTIDAALKRYDASVQNGRSGGRPRTRTQEKPSENLPQTQQEPKPNPEETQEKPSENLDIDMDIDIDKDIDLLVKNKINKCIDDSFTHVRMREPYIKFFNDSFDYCREGKFYDAAIEIIDEMISARLDAREFGFKFNHKTWFEKELLEVYCNLDNEKFRKIVTQIALNQEIEDRSSYIMGCVFMAGAKPGVSEKEDINNFLKNLLGGDSSEV